MIDAGEIAPPVSRERKEEAIFSIIGFLKIESSYYLTVTTKAILITQITTDQIFRIDQVDFLPMNITYADNDAMLSEIREIFKDGMYFSNTMDLTSN